MSFTDAEVIRCVMLAIRRHTSKLWPNRLGRYREGIVVQDMSAVGALRYAFAVWPVSVANINVEDNWGIGLTLTLSHEVHNLEGQAGYFYLSDGDGYNYRGLALVADDTGKRLTLTMVNFNRAAGQVLTLSYAPGAVMSPVVPMEAWDLDFTPAGLVAPVTLPPVPEAIWNE